MRSLRDFPFGSRTTTPGRGTSEGVCHCCDIAREVRSCRTTRAGAAEARESQRHVVEDVRLERLGIIGRQHRIEQQPFDMRRVGERIRECQLRAVRRAPERDLVDPERHADGVRVVGVVVGAVEVARRADRRRATGGERVLTDERRRLLQGLANEEARLAGATVVERDDAVPREERVIEVGTVLVAEIEHRRRSLTRAAGDQHHDATLGTLGGERLDLRVIVPGTRPERSSGTTTSEHVTPDLASHAAAAAAVDRVRPKPPKNGARAAAEFRLAAETAATAHLGEAHSAGSSATAAARRRKDDGRRERRPPVVADSTAEASYPCVS